MKRLIFSAALMVLVAAPTWAKEVLHCTDTKVVGLRGDEKRISQLAKVNPRRFTVQFVPKADKKFATEYQKEILIGFYSKDGKLPENRYVCTKGGRRVAGDYTTGGGSGDYSTLFHCIETGPTGAAFVDSSFLFSGTHFYGLTPPFSKYERTNLYGKHLGGDQIIYVAYGNCI